MKKRDLSGSKANGLSTRLFFETADNRQQKTDWRIYLMAGDACIAPTDNRDFSIPQHHNRRVEACFDR